MARKSKAPKKPTRTIKASPKKPEPKPDTEHIKSGRVTYVRVQHTQNAAQS